MKMSWILDHKLAIYFSIFLLIVVFSIMIYPAAMHGATGWIWFALIGIVLCNLIILFFP